MKTRAFTTLELIFVIVVVGILAAVIFPRIGTDNLQKAALKTAEAIRYTQHLAMISDKFDPNLQDWYKEKWQIFFTSSSSVSGNAWSMIIFSDKFSHSGRPDVSEIAINPVDPTKKMTGGYRSGSSGIRYEDKRATKYLNLGKSFGIADVKFIGCRSRAKRISFDELGRPYYGDPSTLHAPYSRLMTSQCRIELCTTSCNSAQSDQKVVIAIEPHTGFVHILP